MDRFLGVKRVDLAKCRMQTIQAVDQPIMTMKPPKSTELLATRSFPRMAVRRRNSREIRDVLLKNHARARAIVSSQVRMATLGADKTKRVVALIMVIPGDQAETGVKALANRIWRLPPGWGAASRIGIK
jgi:hypothetical protein